MEHTFNKKRHETIIHMENVNDSEETFKQLKTKIDMNNIGKGFINIRYTKSGSVVDERFDQNQQEKLKEEVQKISDKEFLQEVEKINDEIVQELEHTVADKIKIVIRKAGRNPLKENKLHPTGLTNYSKVVSYVSNAAISVTWPSTAQKKNAATNVVENTEVRIVNQMNTNVPTVKSINWVTSTTLLEVKTVWFCTKDCF